MKQVKQKLSLFLVFFFILSIVSNSEIIPLAEETPSDIAVDNFVEKPGGKTKWYIAGSFQGWNNTNAETQLKHQVEDFYAFSTLLEAGTHEFKIVKNGTWDGFSNNGNNFALQLTEKTKVNFYVNEKLGQARINVPNVQGLPQYIPALGQDKWPRLVGDIQTVFGEAAWSPDQAKQFFVDYNFDNTVYKLQRSLPVGNYQAKVTFGSNWDENYGATGPNGDNLSAAILDPADVVFTLDYSGDKKLGHNYKPMDGQYDGLINSAAIKFDSRSVTFKKPFGAIKEKSEDVTLRIATAKGDVQVARVELISGAGIAKSYDMRKATTIGEEDYFEAIIPNIEFIGIGIWGYKFILVDGSTKVEYGDDGLSGGSGATVDEGAVPFNLTVYSKDYTTPDWMKNSVVYQIFPDRFFDGNEANNRAKVVDGYRGYTKDGEILPYGLQYFDGGVANDPASNQVWGGWSSYPENPRHNYPEYKPYYPDSKTDDIFTNEFYGGDIQGIEQKIDYLKSIGVTAVYLNPVAWASSNHKYDATDYKHLDPMFGEPVYNTAGQPESGLNYAETRAASDRVFIKFAKAAREKGIKLITDGVFNHVGDDSIYFDRYEKYPEIGAYEYWSKVWDKVNNSEKTQAVAEEEVRSEFTSKINLATGKNYAYPTDFEFTTWITVRNEKTSEGVYKYEGWWGYDSLPVMDAKDPETGDAFDIPGQHEWNSNSYRNHVIGYDLTEKTEAAAQEAMQFATSQRWMWMGARGWRLDVAPDVSNDTWEKFRAAVKSTTGQLDANNEIIDEPVILGEEWGVATKYLLGNQFDSVMNYQFRSALQNYIISGNSKNFHEALEVIRENYPKEAWQAMLNLVGSHDTTRNITKLDNPSWEEENIKIAPEASDKALKQQALTAIFQLGYPGAPTLYYGDEVGVTGTKDPDSRRSFPWERVAYQNGNYSGTGRFTDLFYTYQQAAKVRNDNLDIFATGDMQAAYAEGDVIVYARKSSTKGGLLVINRGNAATIEANVAGFLPNGLNLKDELYGNVKGTTADGKIKLDIPAETGLMMVSTETLISVPTVQNLAASATLGQVALSWNTVAGAESYNIYRSTLEGQSITKIADSTNNSFIDNTVINGTRYYYYVSAVKAGGESSLSLSVTALPSFDIGAVGTPSTVSDVTLGVGNKTGEITLVITIPGLTDDVTLTGKEAPNTIARLAYYKAGTEKDKAMDIKLRYKADTTDGKSKIYYGSFEPTEPGTYNYFAKVSTNNGDSYTLSSEASMNTVANTEDTTVPTAPILQEILVESIRSELNWSSTAEDASGFEIYRKAGSGQYEKIATVDSGARKYVDFTVSNDTSYTYKVAAFDSSYNRAYSEEKSVTPTLVMVDVTLRLHIPDYTPKTDDIYISGSINGWNASGGKLTVPSGATTRDVVEYSFKMMAGKQIEYKYTRGSWPTEAFTSHTRVENDTADYGNWAYSSTDTNMKLTIKNQGGNKMLVDDYVLRWVDMPMMISMPRISYGEDIEYTTAEDHFTLKGKVPFGVAFTINDKDISGYDEDGMNEFGDVYVENIPLNIGLNVIKLHIEPKKETLGQPWYIDKGRASQATKTITMNITRNPANENVAVEELTLDKSALTLKVGESSLLIATITPENATNKKITWTTSNPETATVDVNGKITALAVGSAEIVATTEDGGYKATCKVTVEKKASSGEDNADEDNPPTDAETLPKTGSAVDRNILLVLGALFIAFGLYISFRKKRTVK